MWFYEAEQKEKKSLARDKPFASSVDSAGFVGDESDALEETEAGFYL